MNLKASLTDLLVRDRISTTMACDVMNKSGWLNDITPINRGHHLAGEVKYIFAHAGTNYHLHEQISDTEEDKIIFVDAIDCDQRAVFGDIVSNYLLQHRQARAIVTNGYMRDIPELVRDNLPIWCKGSTPIGCHRVQTPVSDEVAKFVKERQQLFESSILICDDSGVALVSPEWINEDFKNKIDFIEAQEEVWHYCVDMLKWNTYETVCLQRYFDVPGVVPEVLLAKLKNHKQKN
jgi:4-hydroxy-4-methyl-2-oxoglutarate aldolase